MLAESTESRLVTGTTDEEVLGLWTVGRRIVLGKLNPRCDIDLGENTGAARLSEIADNIHSQV